MSDKIGVLFVDDEQNVVMGLSRMLRSMRHEWDMEFAKNGPEALDIMATRPFDAIVSDMRMPGMDGVALLSRVRDEFPQVSRITLSGQAAKETVLRSVGLVHQYLAKPCTAEKLKSTINGIGELRKFMPDEGMRKRLSMVKSLLSLPALYEQFIEQIESRGKMDDIAETVSQDIGMSARVMQLVSSSFFGNPMGVLDPFTATTVLGFDTVKTIQQLGNAFSQFDPETIQASSLEALCDHGRAVAVCARRIAEAETTDEKVINHCFVAGLLHDIGRLVFVTEFPEAYASILASMPGEGPALLEAERSQIGQAHPQVGAYLMGLWGLDGAIVEAIGYHHDPTKAQAESFGPLTAVHVADVLVHQNESQSQLNSPPEIDETYLTELGLSSRLEAWQEASNQTQCQRVQHA